jgi:hypothetical protein
VLYSVYRSTASSFTPSASNQIITGVAGLSYADTTASPSSTYYYLVQATNTAGTSASSNLASGVTVANGGKIATDVLKIDSGFTGTTPPTGWLVDGSFTGASTPGSSTTHAITISSSILNPAPAAVYQTNRRANGGSFTYTATGLTPGGSYLVDLHFSDNFSTAAKQRQFNVAINGTQVLNNFDIFATAGGEFIANVQSFYAVADTNGIITVQFSNGAANNAQINGIEIGLGTVPVPVAPSGLAASTLSDTQISLNWSASSTSNAVYELFRSTTPGFQPSPSTLVTTTANTSFTDTALTPGTAYYYIVVANNSILTSLPSNQATATTQSSTGTSPTAPVAPTALKAFVVSSREIDLLWTGSSTHSVTYQLFRSTTPGFTPSSANLVTTTSATGYSDIGLTEATTYYYLVEATNTNGSSSPSNQVTAQTGGPGSITAVSGSGQTAQVGTAFASPLVVSVQDAESNPVAGVTVTFAGAGITFPSGATAVTDSNGQAQVTAQPSSSGTLTISASVDGVSAAASFSETGTAISQTITFGPLSQVTYGAGPITLLATASSNLPVSFTAAGPATVSGSVLTITGAGQVTVTASQAGDTTYAAASPVSQSFTVAQAASAVTWATPAAITYGTALSASQLDATASVPGTFTYSPASGTILGAGAQTLSVTFTPADIANYTIAKVSVVQRINPAILTVTANSLSAPFGTIPTLGATITGFVNGDSNSVVSGTPALATTANSLSLPGAYPITIATGSLSAANYIFSFIDGTYTVTFTGSVPASGTQCNGAYSGSFSGNITVSANQVCVFVGGSVGGNLHLTNGTVELVQSRLGGDLQISGGIFSITSGTTITGNLQVQGIPANSAISQVCGSAVTGDLTLQNNGTPVLVGTADGSCAGNTIQGNVTVQSNTAMVSVLGNTIGNNLTVQSNSASTIVDGNTLRGNLVDKNNTADTQVFTNQVRGNLQCSGNKLITGGSNVAASKQGQCASF